MNAKLICTFTTGRSGTALLTQLFSGQTWKNSHQCVSVASSSGNITVVHEIFENLPIRYLQTLPWDSKESLELQRQVLQERVETLCTQEHTDGLFVTDNRIGRFFGPSLPLLPWSSRIIHIVRNADDVVDSFTSRLHQKQAQRTTQAWQNYEINLWHDIFYHPQAPAAQISVTRAKWAQLTLMERVYWYYAETEQRWLRLQKKLLPGSYITINYTDLMQHNTLEQLSNFIGLPCHYQQLQYHVNPRIRPIA